MGSQSWTWLSTFHFISWHILHCLSIVSFLNITLWLDKKYCAICEWNELIWVKHPGPDSGANRWGQAGSWAGFCLQFTLWCLICQWLDLSGLVSCVLSLLWMSCGWGGEINFHQEAFSHWASCWEYPWGLTQGSRQTTLCVCETNISPLPESRVDCQFLGHY